VIFPVLPYSLTLHFALFDTTICYTYLPFHKSTINHRLKYKEPLFAVRMFLYASIREESFLGPLFLLLLVEVVLSAYRFPLELVWIAEGVSPVSFSPSVSHS